jgi:hypothetical protein
MLRFTASSALLVAGACALMCHAPSAQATLATSIPDGAIGQIALSAQSGYSVANAGDLNGDGFQDMAVGIYGYSNGQTSEGAVFVYFGSASGVDPTADAVLEVNQADARFGAAVAGAGDVNGDGFDDLIVGAPFFDVANPNDGRAFLFFGGPGAFDTTADAALGLSQGSAFFGVSVSGAGDVNGDGYADVLVGSSGFDGAATNTGAALLYFGGAGAFNTTVDANLQSANGGVRFGSAVAGVGDVNGDGFADILIGSPFYANGQANEGAAFLYLGGSGAFNAATDAHYEVNQADAEFGTSVAAAGDLNGDGFSDVIIGALRYDNGQTDEGGAFVYYGGSTVNSVLDATLEGNQASAAMGNAVTSLGDVNADGYGDVAVGAPLFDGSNADSGQIFVYLGAASGIVTSVYKQFDAGVAQPARLAYALAGGDFNGDGYTDLIAGTPDFTGTLTNQGRALVYFGGTVIDNGVADARVGSGQGSGQLGHSVATGDVNGDGYADLVSGAFGYDGTGGTNSGRVSLYLGGAAGFNTIADAQLDGSLTDMRAGGAVAVGDVNGDGYGDIIVGAPDYSNGHSLEGAALIYFGGVGAFNTQVDATLEVNQIGASFGSSVAYAGDVNGDGFGDVLVGAPNYDGLGIDDGAMFVYYGGAIFNTTADATLRGGQGAAYLGWRVAGAGDLNGDGYADIAAGGIGFDGSGATNAGVARVYFGGASFDTTPDAEIEGGQSDARLGSAIAGAGDVNGDGYSDLIIGVNEYDNGQLDEGRAYIYKGGAGAFSTTVYATLEINQVNSGFGSAVAGAGDVNGDGYADVLVGAPEFDVAGSNDEGAAFLYLGSATSFVTTHAVRMSQTQLATRQGFAVAFGDVNGDGYSDPIIGAPSFDNGVATDEGAASVYLSNSIGKAVLPQQFSGLLTGPVDDWGISQNPSGFTVGMTSFSSFGRERSKLELQACPAGAAFGAGSCMSFVSSSWVDTTATANGAVVAGITSALTPNRLYHWRARVLYAPSSVTQAGIVAPSNPRRGPWRRMRGASDVTDVRVVEFAFRNGFE